MLDNHCSYVCVYLGLFLMEEKVYLDQLARHGSHVGAAVTLDLRHISHASNAEPEVLEEDTPSLVL